MPTAGDNALDANPISRIRRRLVREPHPWTKVLVPKAIATRSDAELGIGSHTVCVGEAAFNGLPVLGSALAHFPIRSVGQYATKVLMGHLGFTTTRGMPAGAGFQYREAFETLKRSSSEFAERFYVDASQFAVESSASFEPELIDDPFPYEGPEPSKTPSFDERDRVLAVAIALSEAYAGKAKRLEAQDFADIADGDGSA